jgi:hypothetical protein
LIENIIITNSIEESDDFALDLSRWEQVFSANLLKDVNPEEFNRHLLSLIPNFEVYVPYFYDLPTFDLVYLLLENYSHEITEMAKTRFKELSAHERIVLIPYIEPDHLPQLLPEHEKSEILSGLPDIEDINSPVKNKLSTFCLTAFYNPDLLLVALPKMDALRLHLLFKFLSESQKTRLINDYTARYKQHVETLQRLKRLSQANVDVSKELIDAQIAIQTLIDITMILKKFTSHLEKIESHFVHSKKALELINAITLRNLDNIPKAFIDSLTAEKMTNPVKLPKPDNTYVDLTTLHNPNYFEVEVVNNVTTRKNYFTGFFYPDYTLEENPPRLQPGYEFDPKLRHEIETYESLRRSARLKGPKKT